MNILNTPQQISETGKPFTFEEARTLAKNLKEAYDHEGGQFTLAMDALQVPAVYTGFMALLQLVVHAVDTLEQIEVTANQSEEDPA